MLAKTVESPLDSQKVKPVNPKGNQSWIFIGRTDAEAPVLWPPDEKNWLLKTDPDARKDWRQEEEKVTTEHEMVGWTWVWASSRSWWWTGRPGVLQSMGLQRVRHNWATELNWCQLNVQNNFKLSECQSQEIIHQLEVMFFYILILTFL